VHDAKVLRTAGTAVKSAAQMGEGFENEIVLSDEFYSEIKPVAFRPIWKQ
jgi:hypothetical protein